VVLGEFPGFPETPFGVGRDSYSVSHYTLMLIFYPKVPVE